MTKHLLERQQKLSGFNDTIIDAIEDKKGIDIVTLDLTEIEDAVADYFIICHGDSDTQVRAIADHVDFRIIEASGEKPWHKEGTNNAEWIILDYVDVVIHVFHREKRGYYQLEELWSDAVITHH